MQIVLEWMENSTLNGFITQIAWLFPASETIHFLGLILLFGSLVLVDLRLLGVARAIPLRAILAFVPWAIAGFLLNAVSGTLFVFSDPFRYYYSPGFRIKMAVIALAILNAIWFKLSLQGRIQRGMPLDGSEKLIALLSLLLWSSVVVAGRMIPYVG